MALDAFPLVLNGFSHLAADLHSRPLGLFAWVLLIEFGHGVGKDSYDWDSSFDFYVPIQEVQRK